ncbi:MAG TPA: alpha/beta fold hydrolase [Gammaproteobacteria bacterium]
MQMLACFYYNMNIKQLIIEFNAAPGYPLDDMKRMRILIFLVLVQVMGCTNLLFYPMKNQVITPDQLGIRYDDVYLSTEDNRQLHGWKLYAVTQPLGTILYFHGNAENISTHFANVSWLTKHGYDVYLYDYRGYGKSEGQADLDLIIKDAEAMIGDVVGRQAVENIIVIGQSLGASIAIYAVAHTKYKKNITALISISAFSDYRAVTQDALSKSWLFWLFQWPLSYTISNQYSPIKSVADVSPIPIFIMHSPDDEMIDVYHAERLLKEADEPKQLLVLQGGHNTIFNYENNRKTLLESLDSLN